MSDEVARVDKGSLPFVMMDAADDALIIAELEGRILETWVYEFSSGGQKVQGLSKIGIDQATRELAKKGEVLRELEHEYKIDPTDKGYMLFTVKVGRYAISQNGQEILLDTAIGAKRQWTKMLRRDGRVAPDPFWFEKGLAKAARNAKHRLIPEEIKSKILAFAKKKGRVQEIKPEQPPESSSQQTSEPETTQKPSKTTKPDTDKNGASQGWYALFIKNVQKIKGEFEELNNVGAYYAVLGNLGYEHANEVKKKDQAKELYAELKKQLKFLKEMEEEA